LPHKNIRPCDRMSIRAGFRQDLFGCSRE